MPVHRHAALLLLPALFACGPQPGQCTGPELKEIKTVQSLITETRADIARGYRVEREPTNAAVNFCLGGFRSHVGLSFCTDPGSRTRPVAIDQTVEKRKLAALEKRRDALLASLAARDPDCGPGAGT